MEERRYRYDFLKEPRGKVYRQLLVHLSSLCCYAVFVLTERGPSNELKASLVRELEQDLVEVKRRTRYPGFTGSIIPPWWWVHVYRLTPHCVQVLCRVAKGLGEWDGWILPMDLSLLRPDWEPCLVALNTEREQFVCLTPSEKAELVRQVPVRLARVFEYKVGCEYDCAGDRWWEGTEVSAKLADDPYSGDYPFWVSEEWIRSHGW